MVIRVMIVNMLLAFWMVLMFQVTMIIDSGASCNVTGRNVWEYLKANKVACTSTKSSRSCMHMVVISHYKLQACLLQKCLLERVC